MMRETILFCLITAVMMNLKCAGSGVITAHEQFVEITDNWQLISSENVNHIDDLHELNWRSENAFPITVPRTVFAGLLDNEVYNDPFFATRLREIDKSPFQKPWIYRRVFDLQRNLPSDHVELILEGFNYRANVWLNGTQIGRADTLVGPFKMYNLDITELAKPKDNVLVMEIIRPAKDDLTIGWVDWNPYPPDDNIGIWRPVKLRQTGAVSLDDVFVQPHVNLETLDEAHLVITGRLVNHSNDTQTGRVTGRIDERVFHYDYSLQPGERHQMILRKETHPELYFEKPKLWWPNLMGDQPLYDLHMHLITEGRLADQSQVRFGIREVDDFFNEEGYRGYKINGKPVLIRGGGWVDDLFLREDPQRVEDQLRYGKHMNLNAIRMESFWGSSRKVYEVCDELGLLVMIGWTAHWEWEGYANRPTDGRYILINTPEEWRHQTESYRDQVKWARNHPSVFLYVGAADMLPRPELERMMLDMLAEEDTTRPWLAGCRQTAFGGSMDYTSELTGPVGVKMVGPYAYVTPNYWYEDTQFGGAFSFNTETGPGLQPTVLESIKRFMPEDKLWPLNEMWDFHTGRGAFATFKNWIGPFDARYGRGDSVEEFAYRAQISNFEALRASFEAHTVRWPVATGLIHWMYNSAWPGHLWQFFDYYLMPTGALYGTRQACQPLNLAYDYSEHAVYITNMLLDKHENMQADIKILNTDSEVLFEKSVKISADPNTSARVIDLPKPEGLSTTYFLDLRLNAEDGSRITSNFYWLSTGKDELDWESSDWYITRNKSYADLTGLFDLQPADIKTSHRFRREGGNTRVTVTLENPEDALAFFIELRVAGEKSDQTVLPVFWDDNYVTLLPGEKRTLSATFRTSDLNGEKPVFSFTGVNLKN